MEFKGTKGEWMITEERPFFGDNQEYNGGFEIVSKDNSENKVAEIYAYSFWGLSIEQAESNAKLIAAAPEMFEMLSNISIKINLPRYAKQEIEQLLTKITQ